ncbi:MAG TPA: hypothetical protein VGP95_16730, partial [Gemmatimonadaceae bacterium]|nr:hypothetical protein [Gemmatimonadaceae bacterium]
MRDTSRLLISASVALAVGGAPSAAAQTRGPDFVQVVPREGERRVDVLVGGKPFTSYIYPT